MSRDFELLQRAERERGAYVPQERVNTVGFDVAPAPPPEIAEIIPCLQPSHELTESARREVVNLVQQLFLLPDSISSSAIVTAVEPQCSTSRLTAAAAEILAANTDGAVCVVDANFWSPTLHDRFGVLNKFGLAEMMSIPGPAVQNALRVERNLWLITAGSIDGQQERAGSEQMRLRIAELRLQFKFLLVNAPSIDKGNYAVALGKMTDGAVLVVEADETRREAAQRAKQLLEASGVQVLGAVLNNRKFPIPAAVYALL